MKPSLFNPQLVNPPFGQSIICAVVRCQFHVLSNVVPPPFRSGIAYLEETNVGGLLAEALTADVQAILADKTGSAEGLETWQNSRCRSGEPVGADTAFAGALAVASGARVPDGVVRHIGRMSEESCCWLLESDRDFSGLQRDRMRGSLGFGLCGQLALAGRKRQWKRERPRNVLGSALIAGHGIRALFADCLAAKLRAALGLTNGAFLT